MKIALRNLLRNKAYAAINISGLAVGIASCILLFIIIRYELSYDKFQPASQNIYRVVTQDKFSDGISYGAGTPFPVPDALRVDIPQITTGVLYASYGSQVTVTGKDNANNSSQKKFIEPSGIFFADPQFFSVFHFEWLSGSPALLDEPNNTVLTKKMAEKYFGTWQNAVGKFIKLDNKLTLKVAGILQDVPANSDFTLGVVTSYITFKNDNTYGYSTEWGRTTSDEQVYVRLP
ncbi:MAG: ABC transporter permease, partial [Ginsengibacter sp.]